MARGGTRFNGFHVEGKGLPGMFFRKKKRDDSATAKADKAQAEVTGTAPNLVEAPDAGGAAAAASKVDLSADETVAAATVAPVPAAVDGSTEVAADDDAVRLFPGFERDDFEVGFRAHKDSPSLLVRWKDGGEWFHVPALFNRGVLAAMDERESSSDLNRLLRNYGYDIDAESAE